MLADNEADSGGGSGGSGGSGVGGGGIAADAGVAITHSQE